MGSQDLQTFKIYTRVAEEIQSRSPIATYFLKTYTLNKAIEYLKSERSQGKDVSERTQEIKGWLQQLEELKNQLEVELRDKEKCKESYQNFTFTLFHQSDQEYLKGNFSRKLAKDFLYVSVLFDAWELVGVQSDHIKNKKAYANDARFKIMDALSKGHVPEQNGEKEKRGRAASDDHPSQKGIGNFSKPNGADPLAKMNFHFTESVFIPQKVLDKKADERFLGEIDPNVRLDLPDNNNTNINPPQTKPNNGPLNAQEVKNRLNLPMGKSVTFETPIPTTNNNYPNQNGVYYDQPYNRLPENYQPNPLHNQYVLPTEFPQNPPSYYYGPPQNLYSNNGPAEDPKMASNFYAPYQGMPYYPEGASTKSFNQAEKPHPSPYSNQQAKENDKSNTLLKLYQENTNQTSVTPGGDASLSKLSAQNTQNQPREINGLPSIFGRKVEVVESVFGYVPAIKPEDEEPVNVEVKDPAQNNQEPITPSFETPEKNIYNFQTPNPSANSQTDQQNKETPGKTTPLPEQNNQFQETPTPDRSISKNLSGLYHLSKYQPTDVIYETPGEKSESESNQTNSNLFQQNAEAESLDKVLDIESLRNSMYYHESEKRMKNQGSSETGSPVEKTTPYSNITQTPGYNFGQTPNGQQQAEKSEVTSSSISYKEAKEFCLLAASELDFNHLKEAKEKIIKALKLLEQIEANQTTI